MLLGLTGRCTGSRASVLPRLPRVDDVEVKRHLVLFATLLNGGDGFRDSQLLAEREHVGRHDAPGGLVAEGQQLVNTRPWRRLHPVEQCLTQRLGELAEDQRGVVRRN